MPVVRRARPDSDTGMHVPWRLLRSLGRQGRAQEPRAESREPRPEMGSMSSRSSRDRDAFLNLADPPSPDSASASDASDGNLSFWSETRTSDRVDSEERRAQSLRTHSRVWG